VTDTDNSPEAIVDRANQSIRIEGFLGCRLVSRNPPVLAYDFDSGMSAEAFQGQCQLLADTTGFRYCIDNRQPTVVIEYR
jgi:hypothetical protein